MHLFLELAEGTCLSGLVLLEELENLLHALASELLTNGVEVGGFVPPEGQLSERVGMVSLFEGHLWVLSELCLNLTRPVDGGVLKHGSLVFRRGLLVLSDVRRGQRQVGLALNETNSDLEVSEELMVSLHEVFGHQV